MTKKKIGGGAGHHPGTTPAQKIATASQPQDRVQATAPPDLLRAVGEYHPPAGRRTLGVIIVRRCPGCAHLHLHRIGSAVSADGATRVGSCGAEYKITARVPAPRLGDAA